MDLLILVTLIELIRGLCLASIVRAVTVLIPSLEDHTAVLLAFVMPRPNGSSNLPDVVIFYFGPVVTKMFATDKQIVHPLCTGTYHRRTAE